MGIREEHPEDYNSILRLTHEVFLTLDYPGRQRMDEHFLVSLLRGSKFLIPELCFVMERGGEIAGHILYTKSEILKADGTKTQTITFGPLSVLPKYHRQGIGSALVRHSLEKARELGYGAVLITGVPNYYPKLGFKRAQEYRLTLSDGTSPDAFMAYELRPGYLSGGGYTAVWHLNMTELKMTTSVLQRFTDGLCQSIISMNCSCARSLKTTLFYWNGGLRPDMLSHGMSIPKTGFTS